MYLLGFDIGSSSIKVALVSARDKKIIRVEKFPATEMEIQSVQPGYAEQDPELWWKYSCMACKKMVSETGIDPHDIEGIGISYQMHGLVLLDKKGVVLRPSIIWCDSRAVQIGNQAFETIGASKCLQKLYNSPGNFTASKLRWVIENEPEIYAQCQYFMLPGDFIAFKMTGEVCTTVSGLSEGIFWDFERHDISGELLDYYQIDFEKIPRIVPSFANQGKLHKKAAEELGLKEDIPVCYRAGDQPNNALSLSVFEPGQVAATGGTSGVVYAVVDTIQPDSKSRVNNFAHVNHTEHMKRIGVLLCINSTGILYSWLRSIVSNNNLSYPELENLAAEITIGADGVRIIPFGNGAERMLNNIETGMQIHNVAFNRHGRAHLVRAGLESIAFAFQYGLEIIKEMGLQIESIRVGNDNLFQSEIFSNTLSTLMDVPIEVVETTGAVGAAQAAGIGSGVYSNLEEAFSHLNQVKVFHPQQDIKSQLEEIYQNWKTILNKQI